MNSSIEFLEKVSVVGPERASREPLRQIAFFREGLPVHINRGEVIEINHRDYQVLEINPIVEKNHITYQVHVVEAPT